MIACGLSRPLHDIIKRTAYMKNLPPKRVCAIHDLSAYGRCALTVVIPTLSALGIQTIPLPTALMSTHTGGFSDIYIRDLSEDMLKMAEHWESLGVHFDSIYSGFLLSPEQGEIVCGVIEKFRTPDTLVLVDPVMGDDGELYSTCSREMRSEMEMLCKKADVITPNLTEACLLTHTPYPEGRFSSRGEAEHFARTLLGKLGVLCERIAITGIELEQDGNTFVVTACADGDDVRFFEQSKIGASYPGTGELFASVLLGKLLGGDGFFSAAEFSGRFVAETISISEGVIEEPRQGTALETALGKLWKN